MRATLFGVVAFDFEADLMQNVDELHRMALDPTAEGQLLTIPISRIGGLTSVSDASTVGAPPARRSAAVPADAGRHRPGAAPAVPPRPGDHHPLAPARRGVRVLGRAVLLHLDERPTRRQRRGAERFVRRRGGVRDPVGRPRPVDPGTAALAGVVAGKLHRERRPSGWAIVAAIAVGVGVGLVNGLLIHAGLNPLVVTIASLTAVGGIANLVAGGVAIRNITQLDWAGSGRPLGIPSMVFIVAGLYFVAWLFLTQTRAGARLQAVGGNAEAVRRIGVNADHYRILGFMLGGTCGALAGLATVATTRQASPSASVSLLFAALTAVALSGMPLTGGRGSFPRVLVGTLIIATINSALVIRGIQPYWTTIITGVLLILALVFEKVMTSAVTARLTETSHQSVHETVGGEDEA